MKNHKKHIIKTIAAPLMAALLLIVPATHAAVTDTLQQAKIILASDPDASETIRNRTLSKLDLGYWYNGINEDLYSAKLQEAAFSMPCTGSGYCAAWAGYVYQAAGLGYLCLNANEMWYYFGFSSDTRDIKPGMIIAVPHSPTSALGRKYGHAGVLVKNPAYADFDTPENRENAAAIAQTMEELEEQLISEENDPSIDTWLRQRIQSLQDMLDPLLFQIEHNCVYAAESGGFTFEYDADGNEKWLVLHNTDRIEQTALSRWISKYDMSDAAAWGWGYLEGCRFVPFTGDLPVTTPFVYHTTAYTPEPEIEDPLWYYYDIDFNYLSDQAAYEAICYYCRVTPYTVNTLDLYLGVQVDADVYYELLSYMTYAQAARWENILFAKQKEDEERKAREEASAASEEETSAENGTDTETPSGENANAQPQEGSADGDDTSGEEESTEEETTTSLHGLTRTERDQALREAALQQESADATEPSSETDPSAQEPVLGGNDDGTEPFGDGCGGEIPAETEYIPESGYTPEADPQPETDSQIQAEPEPPAAEPDQYDADYSSETDPQIWAEPEPPAAEPDQYDADYSSETDPWVDDWSYQDYPEDSGQYAQDWDTYEEEYYEEEYYE